MLYKYTSYLYNNFNMNIKNNQMIASNNCNSCIYNGYSINVLSHLSIEQLINIFKQIINNEEYNYKLINYNCLQITCTGNVILNIENSRPYCDCFIMNTMHIYDILNKWIIINDSAILGDKCKVAKSLQANLLNTKTKEYLNKVFDNINM